MCGTFRVDCSWSQCFKNHYAQTYARHGFQLSHSICQATLERQREKCLAWAKDKKNWTAAEWSKVSLMKVNLAFPLEIRVPESGGREERHTVHVA